MIVLLEYLYRDAGNNKIWGEVFFRNDAKTDLHVLNLTIRNALIDGEFFVAKESGVPKIGFDKTNELDHEWYEFDRISLTNNAPDGSLSCDISEFISTLEETSKKLALR